jgi:hypothetical protein
VADLKAGLYSWLTATLSASLATRVYPLLAPSTATLPYLTFQRLTFEETAHLGGQSGLIRSPVQLDVWGESSEQVETIVLALHEALDGFSGLMGSVQVERARITGLIDDIEEPSEARATGIWRCMVQADVWYRD